MIWYTVMSNTGFIWLWGEIEQPSMKTIERYEYRVKREKYECLKSQAHSFFFKFHNYRDILILPYHKVSLHRVCNSWYWIFDINIDPPCLGMIDNISEGLILKFLTFTVRIIHTSYFIVHTVLVSAIFILMIRPENFKSNILHYHC